MSVAALFWHHNERLQGLNREQLTVPLVMYLANFSFAMFMSVGGGIYIPIFLGIAVGAAPAIACWWFAPKSATPDADSAAQLSQVPVMEMVSTPAGISK